MRFFLFVSFALLASCSSRPTARSGLAQTDGASLSDVHAGDTALGDDTGGGAPDVETDAADASDGGADTAACSCAGMECGTNACGDTCGHCPQAAPYCYDNLCAVACRPACDGKVCGDDGCDGACGTCGDGEACEAGQCVCVPSCDGKECGDDGCGGACGACPAAAPYCYDNLCAVACQPACAGKVCGDDGCDGACGTCGDGEACEAGQCVCAPSCDGKACGDDGCGGTCGACAAPAPFCVEGVCAATCAPQCAGKACGDDGCGGSCGACGSEALCVDGACVDCACGELECGPGPCGDSCGACPAAAPLCVAGRCQAPVECPTAVIVVQEGEEVIPQTQLHLIGSQSYAASGSVDGYRWEVDQPTGSQSIFQPSALAPDPTFEANVAGTYVFRLVVTAEGVDSCAPAEATVYVDPDEAIHVELLWDTPNDPDQTDEGPVAGSDLDLHFVHPFATGGYDGDDDGKPDGWYDGQFDCFWFNHDPNWGSLDPAIDDDPGLDRDDTDGAGPENVNLNTPENGLTYKVGVHYWHDHGFGPSYATVRVYLYSVLVFEREHVELANHDMWTVSTIDWPAGTVKPALVCSGTTTVCASDAECSGESVCGLRIQPGYVHPFFPSE